MASYKDFLFGGISGMTATSVIQPMDSIKVKIQKIGEKQGDSQRPSISSVARNIYKNEGIAGFYKGLSSALVRQATYGTTRLGLYKYLYHSVEAANGKVSLFEKVYLSLFAGFVASYVGNPFDLALTRFQSDSELPKNERRNYKSFVDAMNQIVKKEGVKGLWRGAVPTAVKTMVMNLSMLATYDQVKEELDKRLKGTSDTNIKLLSSAISGLVCSFCALPFDNIKTKLMSMTKDDKGKYQYSGSIDCWKQSVKRRGVTGLWIGFPAYYLRVAPHAMITLLVQDFLHMIFGEKGK